VKLHLSPGIIGRDANSPVIVCNVLRARKSSMPMFLQSGSAGNSKRRNNLFALLGTVVRLVPSLVEWTGLSGTLGDLVLLEVFAADT